MKLRLIRHAPEITEAVIVAISHILLIYWGWQATQSRLIRRSIVAVLLLSVTLVFTVICLQIPRFWGWTSESHSVYWLRGAGITWGICVAGCFLVAAMLRALDRIYKMGIWPESITAGEPVNLQRRALLRSSSAVALASPFAITGFGVFIQRHEVRLVEVDLPIPGLSRDLDGIRIAQLSDLHVGAFLNARDLAHSVAMANETKPHVTVITGDLITAAGDPLDDCLDQLAKLRSDAGLLGCMGNHEFYADALDYTAREGARRGIRFLRSESAALRFGDGVINFAGVDYQPFRTPYLVGAGKLLSKQNNELNILLSHNPDVFPVAARQGWDAVLAGHTHGGQVSIEILHQHMNMARFFTRYTYGLFRAGASSIYVTRGIGTVGVPARIGAPPEIALIRLKAVARDHSPMI